eukprot:gb/GECG01009374.1/.p1 GENE.gb/GECG01009374.1/~~gb/GECG01009374.1/.p1  ORF type:complete len:695 (+),score=127.12 gb/GECG01009374.1/:1-2085(+)
MPPPQAISCEICGKKFFKNSYAIHLKQCAKKREDSTSQCEYCGHSVSHDEFENHVSECKKAHKGKKAKKLGKHSAVSDSVRQKIEKADRGESIVPEDGGQLGGEFDPFRRLDEIVRNEDVVKDEPEDSRVECEICHRKFNSDRIAKHQLVCQKVKEKEKQNRRKPYTSEDWRVKGTDFENFKDNRTDVKELKRQAKEMAKGQQSVPPASFRPAAAPAVEASIAGTATETSSQTEAINRANNEEMENMPPSSMEIQTANGAPAFNEDTNCSTDHSNSRTEICNSEAESSVSMTTAVDNTTDAEEDHSVPASTIVGSDVAAASTSVAQKQASEVHSTTAVSTLHASSTNNQLNASMSSTGSTGKSKLRVGDRVKTSKGHEGILRFKGRVWGLWKGMWYGVELNEAYGKNDGSCQDVKYFECTPGHGVFVRPHTIVPVRKWDDDVEEIKQKEKEEKQRLYQEQLRIREKLAAKQAAQKEQGKHRKHGPEKPSGQNPKNDKSKEQQSSVVPRLKTDSRNNDAPAGSAIEAVRKLSARSSGRNNSAGQSSATSTKHQGQSHGRLSARASNPGSDPSSHPTSATAKSSSSLSRGVSKRSEMKSTVNGDISTSQSRSHPSSSQHTATKTSNASQDSGVSKRKPNMPSSKPLSETAANKPNNNRAEPRKEKNQEAPDDAAALRRKRAEFFEKKFKEKEAPKS